MFFALRRLHHTTSFFAKIPRVKNGREVTPHGFLFRWKSVSRHFSLLRLCHPPSFFAELWKMAGRSHHTVSFFAKNLRVGTFVLWGRATQLPFSLTTRMARGQRYCLKRNPMCIFVPTRHPTWAKSSPTCALLRPRNVSTPNPNCTAPAPFSPSLVWLLSNVLLSL